MNDEDIFWANLPQVSYHWLRKKLNDDEVFTEQAAIVLKRLRHGNHNHVYGSAEALLNYWAEERELTTYQRGAAIDVTDVTLYADENGQFDAAEVAVEQGWRIDRTEFIAVLTRYRMTVPHFLTAAAPSPGSGSQLTLLIDGREALPVRAIPYVTGWSVSPDEVAKGLARQIGPPFARLKDLFAYHVQADSPIRILPKEWDAVAVRLAALEKDLKTRFPDGPHESEDPRGYAAWRTAATLALPSGVFVWWDEFEREFHDAFSSENLTLRGERSGDRDLSLNPMFAPGIKERLFEGFLEGTGQMRSRDDSAAEVTSPNTAHPDDGGMTGRSPTREVKAADASTAAKNDAKPNETGSSHPEGWKQRIQAQAAEIWRRDSKFGSPTRLAIINELARWCRANGVTTAATGVFPSADYIYRHIIDKKHWTEPKGLKGK